MSGKNDLDKRSVPSVPPFLLLLITFAAGVFLDRLGWVPGRADQQPATLGKTFGPFWEAWNKVQDNFVDRSRVDDRLMTQGAITGMLRSLGDEGHTAYLTKEERDRATEELGGQMQGIGARVSMRGRKPTIIQVMPGSPAQAAGLQAGDVMVSVDGWNVEGYSLSQVVSRVRGKAGTEVKLLIQRTNKPKPFEITFDRGPIEVVVTRGEVKIPEVSWHILPGSPKLAHLVLQRFSKESGKQMKEELDRLLAQGIEGLILDLRGNGGGYKDQCVEITSQFLPEGATLFIQVDARGNQEEITALGDGKLLNLPMAVLIDGGTASSGEILVGALQDHGRAAVIGTRTVGTGTVLREYVLSDGSSVRLAIYKWLTPKGREIWHKGISPDKDLEVSLPEDGAVTFPDPEVPLREADLRKSKDSQLLKAIDVLSKKIRS